VFNVLPLIPYHKLPEAMGCDNWLSVEVKTVGELDDVIERIQSHDGAAYISVAIPPSESKPLPEAVRNRMYKVNTPTTH
jgi:indolepyruvate decarboxylase